MVSITNGKEECLNRIISDIYTYLELEESGIPIHKRVEELHNIIVDLNPEKGIDIKEDARLILERDRKLAEKIYISIEKLNRLNYEALNRYISNISMALCAGGFIDTSRVIYK
ncbi:MAG: hypothetical protein ARM1_0825 [Candidatus Micrarchaeota archaeon]|nr:MAG: hypothetical protein ARM1_0825 [Candidatus Micrarchaeota archaeon]